MRAISLLIVFVLAKALVLSARDIEWSWSAVAAFFWQDVAVAIGMCAVEWPASIARTGSRVAWLAYGALVGYTAANVPVMAVLSTPLTWPMLRATSGTLADSILLYVTGRTTLLLLLTLGAGSVAPVLVARAPRISRRLTVGVALAFIALGASAASWVDTGGLHRNVIVALVASGLPRVDARAAAATWTTPVLEETPGDDYSYLRGRAHGHDVVLVSLESTAAQYLRLYGATENLTPRLDELARRALVFDNGYAAYPESIKGLFSILCSTFPAFDTTPAMYERAPCQPLPAILAANGYRTALFHSGRFAYLGMESIVLRRGFQTLEDAGLIGGRHESSFGVDEPSTVARMLSWIDSLAPGERFFLTYLPIAGHHPYEAPGDGPFPDDQEIGRYRNALYYADHSLGALIDGLRARGRDRNTLWIVLGDHGEAMGQHDGNYGHTFFLYEENVRVPFLVAAPGLVAGTARSRTVVSLIDTAPTILDLLDIAIPAAHQGHSALDPGSRMALFFTDYSLPLVGLRDGRWKFVHDLESGRSKLFDLLSDPGEQSNLADRHAARAATYGHLLQGWSAAQKAHLLDVAHLQPVVKDGMWPAPGVNCSFPCGSRAP